FFPHKHHHPTRLRSTPVCRRLARDRSELGRHRLRARRSKPPLGYVNLPRLSLLQPQPAGERLRAHPLELLPQRVARVGETVLDTHRYGQASPVGDFTYHCVASSRTATPPAAPRKPTQ